MMRRPYPLALAFVLFFLAFSLPALAQDAASPSGDETDVPLLAPANAEPAQTSPSETEDAEPAESASPVEEETPAEEETDETDETVAEDETDSAAEVAEPAKPQLPPLSPEMAAFRDQTRRTLARVYARPLSTANHLPAEVISFCLAFGHTAEIASGNRSQPKINGVGALCWNYPCGGYKLLRTDGKTVVARVGYGYQQRPGQLLAMLATLKVPADYEVRVGEHRATIADLIASEKAACHDGADLSATLMALAHYAPEDSWKNGTGESWSVERILKQELDRTADAGSVAIIDRLAGISFALAKLGDSDAVDSALLEKARKHVDEYHDYAFELQNADGSWHPGVFAFRGTSKDAAGVLRSTGTILQWLVSSLPAEQLEDPRLIRGLNYVHKQLASKASSRYGVPTSTREVAGLMATAAALSKYDVRYLTPRTPPEPEPEAAEETAATANAAATGTRSTGTASRSSSGRQSSTSRSTPRNSSSRRR